jgi:hypothetical protein
MMQILQTTDKKFIGHVFDEKDLPLRFEGVEFVPDRVDELANGVTQFSNSNYVITAKKV